jgi:uncharacterized protein YqiB (DUF1249 family)
MVEKYKIETVYTRNFDRLVKLGIINDKGELQFTDAISLKSKPYMNLNLDDLGKDDNGYITIAMAHNFKQNGDIMADPDMTVRIIPVMHSIEALTYQLDSMGIFQEVYPEPNKVYPKLKKELNSFLEKWLINLIQQRFKLVQDSRPITVKSSITGCINCNTIDCKNGSKYKKSQDSDFCINRVFAGDKELYEYIATQY